MQNQLLIAAILDLPVVNSDLVGGRAAPEIYMDCFTLFNESITPIMGVTFNNKNLLLDGEYTAKEVEDIMRSFFEKNGNSGEIIGYPISVKKYKKICMKNTISMTEKSGRLLVEKKIEEFLNKNYEEVVHEGNISNISLDTKDGFTQGYIEVGEYKVFVKNENIKVTKKGSLIARAPQVISLLTEDLKPIHNSIVNELLGKKIKICVLESKGYWKEKKFSDVWLKSM